MIATDHKYENKLIHETSPYLLQHAHNPVNWYPWGEEALNKAKEENKLIIVSIGYAACHWCHVMEHESFEDEEVARFMNEHFVSIKVDREERPDIDQVYMNAVQLLTGSGGWPLNCIALPDGRPIYGGTYFPKSQWLNVLQQVYHFVRQNPEKTEEQAQAVTEGIRGSERIYADNAKVNFTFEDLDNLFISWKKDIDYVLGGYNRAPKFPLPVGYQYLLHYYYHSNNKEALEAVTSTLINMADGGIYDQVGGGFARYSTDKYWLVPHFEKMLYDNSQLISLYSMACQHLITSGSKDEKYKAVVQETLEFVQRELTSPEGGFYSSLDADSEGEEGKFYVWNHNEVKGLLGDNANLFCDYFNIIMAGNWEYDKNILHKTKPDSEFREKYNISQEELNKIIGESKRVLLEERERRVRPGLDDKIITAWNGLMIRAYVDAYKAFGDKGYLEKGIGNAEFINTKLKKSDGRLDRSYKNDKSTINAFLDDYAFVISAFISLYQATFNEEWLFQARDLAEYTVKHFYDTESNMFFYTSDIDPDLIARKMEITDNVIPSSNSEMAKNLFMLGHYLQNNDYITKAEKMLSNVKDGALKGGTYYANWDILMAWIVKPPYEVVIIGDDYEKIKQEFEKLYLPNVFLSGGRAEGGLEIHKNRLVEGQTTIYVCQNKVCKLPVTNIQEALQQIEK